MNSVKLEKKIKVCVFNHANSPFTSHITKTQYVPFAKENLMEKMKGK